MIRAMSVIAVSDEYVVDQLLNPSREIVVSNTDGKYLFDSVPYDEQARLRMGVGEYTFSSVPTAHPLGFYSDAISVIAGTKRGTLNGVAFYSGRLTVLVHTEFDTASYGCLYHGFMGGENKILYN